jgi:hypothetical protein
MLDDTLGPAGGDAGSGRVRAHDQPAGAVSPTGASGSSGRPRVDRASCVGCRLPRWRIGGRFRRSSRDRDSDSNHPQHETLTRLTGTRVRARTARPTLVTRIEERSVVEHKPPHAGGELDTRR